MDTGYDHALPDYVEPSARFIVEPADVEGWRVRNAINGQILAYFASEEDAEAYARRLDNARGG